MSEFVDTNPHIEVSSCLMTWQQCHWICIYDWRWHWESWPADWEENQRARAFRPWRENKGLSQVRQGARPKLSLALWRQNTRYWKYKTTLIPLRSSKQDESTACTGLTPLQKGNCLVIAQALELDFAFPQTKVQESFSQFLDEVSG